MVKMLFVILVACSFSLTLSAESEPINPYASPTVNSDEFNRAVRRFIGHYDFVLEDNRSNPNSLLVLRGFALAKGTTFTTLAAHAIPPLFTKGLASDEAFFAVAGASLGIFFYIYASLHPKPEGPAQAEFLALAMNRLEKENWNKRTIDEVKAHVVERYQTEDVPCRVGLARLSPFRASRIRSRLVPIIAGFGVAETVSESLGTSHFRRLGTAIGILPPKR